MHVNTYLHKYKNIFDSSKDRLERKMLSQFSKLEEKKTFVGTFLLPNLNLTLLKYCTRSNSGDLVETVNLRYRHYR